MTGTSRVEVVAAPAAPLGAADVTRRHALAFGDGPVQFPGVTLPEGQQAAAVLAGLPAPRWGASLIVVVLPVLLSDDAGPHLLDASGRLVLAVGEHSGGRGARVAMASADAADIGGTTTLGLVHHVAGPVWEWLARATVDADRRVAALDDLDTVRGTAGLDTWQARWE